MLHSAFNVQVTRRLWVTLLTTAPLVAAPLLAAPQELPPPEPGTPPLPSEPDRPSQERVRFAKLTLADALSRAENDRRMLLVFWTSESYPDVARMRADAFEDAPLAQWVARNAIAVEVDGPKHVAAASAYKVHAYPCVDLIDPLQGLRVERLEGYSTADEMLGSFSGALVGGAAAPKPDGAALEDPYAWLAYANSMWRTEGGAVEAARAYGWVLSNADNYRPGFRRRYFEFLLRRLAYLKPQAMEAFRVLDAERMAIEGRLLTGFVDERSVYELVRVDWWLRRQARTRETFQTLVGRGEAAERARALLFRYIIDDLGRYELFDELLGGLGATSGAAHVAGRFAQIEANLARQAAGEKLLEEELDNRADAVLAASWIYEALLAAGRGQDADAVVAVLAEQSPTGRAFALLVDRAMRRNMPEAALRVGRRGLELTAGEAGEAGERQLLRALAKVPGYVPVKAEGGGPPDE